MPALPPLRPFDPRLASRVASWVRDDQELAWLSPETAPPMTAERLLSWADSAHRQYLFHSVASPTSDPGAANFDESQPALPIGYAELNNMPDRLDQLWIGHLLLDPAARGRGLGTACVRSLLVHGFDALQAQQVILVVVPANQPAIRAYLRAGLIQTGEEWKQSSTGTPYRLLRMAIDRAAYISLPPLDHSAGNAPRGTGVPPA